MGRKTEEKVIDLMNALKKSIDKNERNPGKIVLLERDLAVADEKIELKDTALDALNEQNKALCLDLYTAFRKIKRLEGLAKRLVEQIPFTLNPQYEYDRKLQGGWCAHCHKNEGDGHKENCNVGKFEELKSELAKLKGDTRDE